MADVIQVYDGTIAVLRREMPERFSFRVDDHEFRDIGSMARAQAMSHALEEMKRNAGLLGYDTEITRFRNEAEMKDVWNYEFTRRPEVVRKVRVVADAPKAGEETIEVKCEEVRDA